MSRGASRPTPGAARRVLFLFFAVFVGVAGYWYCSRRAGRPRETLPAVTPPPAKTPATASARPGLRPPGLPPDFESAGPVARGLIAVVVDDVGYEEGALPRLARIEAPLALSVLPGTPHAAQAAALARRKGWDLMVHLPMEPESGKAERGSIGAADDGASIRARVSAAIDAIPGATGLNNHQGSKATADPRVMRDVLTVVKARGLFFLDSRTTPATAGERLAQEMKVPVLARDVFLDDAATEASDPAGGPGALEGAWDRALAHAAKNGRCVVIAHPHPESVEFLLKQLPALGSHGLRAIRVAELLD